MNSAACQTFTKNQQLLIWGFGTHIVTYLSRSDLNLNSKAEKQNTRAFNFGSLHWKFHEGQEILFYSVVCYLSNTSKSSYMIGIYLINSVSVPLMMNILVTILSYYCLEEMQRQNETDLKYTNLQVLKTWLCPCWCLILRANFKNAQIWFWSISIVGHLACTQQPMFNPQHRRQFPEPIRSNLRAFPVVA